MTDAVNGGGTSPLLTIKMSPKSLNAELVVTGLVGAVAVVASRAAGLGPPPSPLPEHLPGVQTLPPALPSALPTAHLPACSSRLLLSPWLPPSPTALPCPAFLEGGLTALCLSLAAMRSTAMAFSVEELQIWPSQEKCSCPPGYPPAPLPCSPGSLRASPPACTAPPELRSFEHDITWRARFYALLTREHNSTTPTKHLLLFQLDLQKLTGRPVFQVKHNWIFLPIFTKRLVLFHFFFKWFFLLRLRRLPMKDKKQCYIFINKNKAL